MTETERLVVGLVVLHLSYKQMLQTNVGLWSPKCRTDCKETKVSSQVAKKKKKKIHQKNSRTWSGHFIFLFFRRKKSLNLVFWGRRGGHFEVPKMSYTSPPSLFPSLSLSLSLSSPLLSPLFLLFSDQLPQSHLNKALQQGVPKESLVSPRFFVPCDLTVLGMFFGTLPGPPGDTLASYDPWRANEPITT
jgi:hypothetical protein